MRLTLRTTGTNSRYLPSADFRALETGLGMRSSMGRTGVCGDNAAMESFFSLLQKNVLDRRCWATRDKLRIAIVTWIERTYHRRHRQDAGGRLTPIEYETIKTTPATQAAIPNLSPIQCSSPDEVTTDPALELSARPTR